MAATEDNPRDEHSANHVPEQLSDSGPVIEWTVHPVKRRPLVSVLVTVFVLLCAVLVYYATESRLFTTLTLLVLFGSLAKFYFPTAYMLSDEGVRVKTTTQTLEKSWKLFRSCYPDKNGILLSPFTRPSRLENFRGLYVMFQDNRDEVTEFVKSHLNRQHLDSEEPTA